jgi:hypothetical protein
MLANKINKDAEIDEESYMHLESRETFQFQERVLSFRCCNLKART